MWHNRAMARRSLVVAVVALGAVTARADEAEEAFRERTRAALLADSSPGPIAGVRTRITLESRVDRAFRLIRAALWLDGEALYLREADQIDRRIEVFDGSIIDGDHLLTAALGYRGRGFGIFTYLEGYRFRVSGRCSFTLAQGPPAGRSALRVLVVERGSVLAPSGDPPAVRCQLARPGR